MFENVSPESVGIKSADVIDFLESVQEYGSTLHSILLMRGDKIFCEGYFAPFTKDSLQRMYSQTKSFVGVAIGLLEEEGKLSLTDKIPDYFRDKIDGELHPWFEEQTIEDMLTMRTCCQAEDWFTSKDKDRAHAYFNNSKVVRPSGTTWEYDSAGSQVLCVLVERLSGKPLLEYMREKLFNKMGYFQTARILKSPTGESWGDSAMLCTIRDMAAFGRLVLNYGTWQGERLMNAEYLKKATSKLVYEQETGHRNESNVGYGYQIWKDREEVFSFVGMGQQLTICDPKTDIIAVCTCNNQGAYYPYGTFKGLLFDKILHRAKKENLPANVEDEKKLEDKLSNLKIRALQGKNTSIIFSKINGKKFIPIAENKQGITEFSLRFNGDEGVFAYTNAQGKKELPFGINKNVFGKFPQYGYSNEYGATPTTDGFLYDCATSATWRTDDTFTVYTQIIDKYLGNLTITFAFKGEYVSIVMTKYAEAYLREYEGEFIAKISE